MYSGQDHIYNAVDLLVGQSVSLGERFHDAATEFLAAVNRADDWPLGLLERARRIERELTASDSLELTIPELDSEAVERIADDILDVAESLSTFRVDAAESEPDEEEFLGLHVVTHRTGHRKASKRRHGRATRTCRS